MVREAGKRPRSNPAVRSCDHCKARKTKCVRPDDGGPCDYCRSVNRLCSTDLSKRRQKPYYFVPEEEYRLLHKLCEQSFPGEDLSLDNLRTLVSRNDKGDSTSDSSASKHDAASVDKSEVPETVGDDSIETDDTLLPEIVNLHEDLGCLMIDSQGEYRYMGAESGAGFNIAVRDWVLKKKVNSVNREMIPTWVKAKLPRVRTDPAPGSLPLDPSILPSQDVLLTCAARYFEDVHSMYWLYSSEDFYTRLEATYCDSVSRHTDSWLCSLHSIIALTAACIPISNGKPDEHLARISLDKAKLLTSKVCDEAGLDSIRALLLLALALLANGFTNSSYLHIGMASRVALSLGLHLDKYPSGVVTKEHARRLWWTLFLFDQDASLQSGKPSFSVPSGVPLWNPPLPSERILNPGLHTPHQYLQYSVSLALLVQEIRYNLYTGPIQGGRSLSKSSFEGALQSLKRWRAGIPQHLEPTSSPLIAPCHRRPIAFLHLRYWSAVMLVTRPFLLCSLLRRHELGETTKLQYFEGLARTCVAATEAALGILETMVCQGIVSSLVPFDFFFGLQVMQLGLIACGIFGPEVHTLHPQRCLSVLRKIGQFGYAKQLLPEPEYQIQQAGLKDTGSKGEIDGDTLPNDAAIISNGHTERDSFSSNALNGFDLPHNAIDDFNFFDANVDEDLMEQLIYMSETFLPVQNSSELLPETVVHLQQ